MKNKKLLSIVLVIAMMLTMVSFAGAATFADVSGATDSAVSRLAGLGILAGYPDGTFKPDNNITRAEFAKVAVTAIGLDTTAGLLTNVNSKFSDVATGKWFTGYVNVATNLGILKGYPDGTFRPDANITEAEAVTMVLRLLGYNDNLAGEWPFDYIVQGNLLSLINTGFNATAKATRGTVATWVSKALDATMVTYDKESDSFKDISDLTLTLTLLEKAFTGTFKKEVPVTEVVRGTADDDYHTMNGLDVSKSVKVANGAFGAGLVNHKVNYTTKLIGADDVIVAIDVLTTAVTGETSKLDTTNKKITIGGTAYTYETVSAPADGTKNVTAYLYKGKIYKFVESATTSGSIVGKSTKTVTTGSTTSVVNTLNVKYTVGEQVYLNAPFDLVADAVITRNGVAATFADLKNGDAIDFRLTDTTPKKLTMVSAWYLTVEGIVNSWTKDAAANYKTVTIDNTTYNVSESYGKTPEIQVGVRTKFTLNEKNEITGRVSVSAATEVVGTLAGTSIGSDAEGKDVFFVTLTNGVSYDVTKAVASGLFRNAALTASTFADLSAEATNAAVKISYSAVGNVTRVDFFVPNATLTTSEITDRGIVVPGTTTYTFNGKSTTSLQSAANYRVIWEGVTGKAKTISAVTFSQTAKLVEAKSVLVSGITTERYISVTGLADLLVSNNAVIIKDGVASNFDAIELGDKVSFAYDELNSANPIVYIEVTTPE